ncbi:MAG TPA: hypothetical protein PLF26_17320, partial [Blastocatellia bacterium]|nr:hypothetical protein [Blastocatellia bacterium]
MNRQKVLVVGFVFAGLAAVIAATDPAYALSRGPFLERTGAPEEQTCVTCHRTYPLDSGPGHVEVLGLPAQYQPSQTYPITVRITDPVASRWGFQITAITDDEAAAGFFQTLTPGVQALGPSMRLGRFYAEHTILGNYDGQRG